jgi:galactokinase
MFQSHEGYCAMGLGSAETDEMVEALKQLGPDQGVYGARISAGGSGGTVVVLLEDPALPRVDLLRRIFNTPYPLILV